MSTFTLGKKITGHFTRLSGKRQPSKGVPGTVTEVKKHTGIIVCEFIVEGAHIVDDFTLEGISIRGKEYGYIALPTDECEDEIAILRLLEEARIAFGADNWEGLVVAQVELTKLGNINPRRARTLAIVVMGFCKSGQEKPLPATVQAIKSCLGK